MRVKLVRDKVVTELKQGEELIPANTLPGKIALLLLKMHEEVQELAREPQDPQEYADVLEVLLEIARLQGVPWAAVEAAFEEKRKAVGAFRMGKVLVQP